MARLAYEIVEAPEGAERTMFLAHGIMGSMRNWRSFAHRLADHMRDWRVVLLDLRGHGGSRDLGNPPHDLEACAGDIAALAAEVGPPDVLVGHSFGGKVVVETSREFGPQPLGVVVLDCPMGESVASEDTEVGRVFDLLDEIEMPVERRSEVGRLFGERGFSRTLAGWMATNLVPAPGGGQHWHFDRTVLKELLADYWRRDYHDYLENPGADRRFLMIKAARSDRFEQEELDRSAELVASGAIEWREVPAAGHWLHIDNPEGLLLVLEDFLATLA